MNSTKNHKLFCWQSFVAYNESNEYKEGRAARGVCGGVVVVVDGGGRRKGLAANAFQPRCVAFTRRFVTLHNGTMASVFVPLICLCVSASSLSAAAIESRQFEE